MVLIIGICLLPPAIMPAPVYEVVYGWRYPKIWQCDSANVTDKGPASGIDRYIVSLGKIDFSQEKQYSWNLCKLPAEKMFCGFNITLSKSRAWTLESSATRDSIVSLQLYGEDGQVLFEESGPLGSEWIWSGPYDEHTVFVYRDTGFQANPDQTYTLEVQLSPQLAAKDIVATVVLTGGGWK